MKKTLLIVAVVGVVALVLGGVGYVGYAYAQDDDPTTPFGHGGFGHGMFGWDGDGDGDAGPMHESMEAAMAEALGMTVEELEAAHDEGKTAWDIAQEQGLTEEEFSTLMFDARTAALEQAIADGTITQEQADWVQSRWDEMKEQGFGPGLGGCDGSGSHGGRGRGGRWSSGD